ncbi:MAG: hypothetical protein ACD_2C00156G0009 [uncultured bacterium (gcode 4)]|uniref:RNA polymerase sigma-70 region 2 domain-containing protein n=1 Tax=uncultured bacterium (gcode 4) TaxID=1234023 RepID=K2GGH7_9BACT|nr:MAG: hypothetical protein ACD_2C00156G0009 [uncultured bacterium (gcode 4)]
MLRDKDFESLSKWRLEIWWEIYEDYAKRIYDFLYYKTFEKEVAEDLTQETFLKAIKKTSSFHGTSRGQFTSWLYSIAYNNYIDSLRTKKEVIELENVEDSFQIIEHYWENIDNKSKVQDILSFLNTIWKTNKDIVIMRIWDDLSYKEISAITWKSEENCKKIVSRTLHQIQANLALIFFICTINL